MTYEARQIANWFIQRAARDGRTLSIMSLLKLVYIAHGWSLEARNQPLISNRIEAWQYGPVIPDVYKAFRPQGVAVTQADARFSDPVDTQTGKFLDDIYRIYGKLPAFQLSDLTHVEGGPWHTATKWGGWFAEIPNDLIQSHYVAKRHAANQLNG